MNRIINPRYLIILFCLTVLAGRQASAEGMTGADLYRQYCSICHGNSGKGDGAAADALRTKPADLTQLTHKYDGKFPELRIMNFIRGDDTLPAHGSRQMPIWGRVFLSIDSNHEVVQMRIYSLLRYVESLQEK